MKIQSAMNNFYLTSVKKKSGDEEDEDDGAMGGNETQDSAAEDLELLMDEANANVDGEDQQDENKIDSKIYTPMNKEEFDFLKQQTIMLRRNHKEEDVFIMKKADQTEIADVLFIHSCVDQLKQYLFYIRKKMIESLSITYFV